ncbi:N-acetylmannosamine-6-phosphate 2-epimerase [Lachnospiraceae bacterium OM02-31]|nr:N-acetylmannosamine-6-phosphate 2-epimerase [Lachnospiraceae bacterium OM02-31]RJW52312.1 N-acetylmannosamine-6-phosphate 2-epimerase [Lachnospiraceae bacterium OM02-3]
MSEKISQIYKKLIVSCQALPDEPLHSSLIMGRMAKAAKEGGACGIRANSREDIEEIKRNVELPIIGIVKKEYADSPVYITPTMREVDALVEAGADIIALDATGSRRPDGVLLDDFVEEIRNRYPGQPLMADCSTVEEVLHADRLGFDFLGTTLVGYTEQSAGKQIEENDFEIIRQILEMVNHPVIAEGNINTPQKARRVLEIGCYSVVVGSIITRPQVITRTFTEEIDKLAMAQE